MDKSEVLVIYGECNFECLYVKSKLQMLGFRVISSSPMLGSTLDPSEVTQDDLSGVKLLINTGVDLSHLDLTGITVENEIYEETGNALIYPYTPLSNPNIETIGQRILRRLETILNVKFTDGVYEEALAAYEIAKNPVVAFKKPHMKKLGASLVMITYSGSVSDYQTEFNMFRKAVNDGNVISVGDFRLLDITNNNYVTSDVENTILTMLVCSNYDGLLTKAKDKLILTMAVRPLVNQVMVDPSVVGGTNPISFSNGHSLLMDVAA